MINYHMTKKMNNNFFDIGKKLTEEIEPSNDSVIAIPDMTLNSLCLKQSNPLEMPNTIENMINEMDGVDRIV